MTTGKNTSLGAAKAAKQDEFYTQLSDIEKELRHYRRHFKGKIVYCNCDDPRISAFFHYFSYNFEKLGLKKLIATCYKSQNMDLFSDHDAEQAVYLEYEGDKSGNRIPDRDEIEVQPLAGDGDFLSPESIELLQQADIVVTNPPFSLFREYLTQLIEYDKKFLILANQNAITYQEVFPLLQKERIWLGATHGDMSFKVPEHYTPRDTRYWVDEDGQKWRSFGNMCWFTNLDYERRHEDLILYKSYAPSEYHSYDNYAGIDVGRVADIPMDYDGVMGVTPGFLTRHNPGQFEIVGTTQSWAPGRTKTYPKQTQVDASGTESSVTKLNDGAAIKLDHPPTRKTYYRVGDDIYVKVYARILIKNKTL